MACVCPPLYYCASSDSLLYYPNRSTHACAGDGAPRLVVSAFEFRCNGALNSCARCGFNGTALEQIVRRSLGENGSDAGSGNGRDGGADTDTDIGVGICATSVWKISALVVSIIGGCGVLAFLAIVLFAFMRRRRRQRVVLARQRRLAYAAQPRKPVAYMEAAASASSDALPSLYLTEPPPPLKK